MSHEGHAPLICLEKWNCAVQGVHWGSHGSMPLRSPFKATFYDDSSEQPPSNYCTFGPSVVVVLRSVSLPAATGQWLSRAGVLELGHYCLTLDSNNRQFALSSPSAWRKLFRLELETEPLPSFFFTFHGLRAPLTRPFFSSSPLSSTSVSPNKLLECLSLSWHLFFRGSQITKEKNYKVDFI